MKKYVEFLNVLEDKDSKFGEDTLSWEFNDVDKEVVAKTGLSDSGSCLLIAFDDIDGLCEIRIGDLLRTAREFLFVKHRMK